MNRSEKPPLARGGARIAQRRARRRRPWRCRQCGEACKLHTEKVEQELQWQAEDAALTRDLLSRSASTTMGIQDARRHQK
jgi:hypothetical protein